MLRQMSLSHSHTFMTLEELFTLENLNNAFYECSKISRWKESTQRYQANLLLNNVQLQEDLLGGTYRISATTNFILNERGKRRFIKAPAIRDRIVQKVLCKKLLVPQLTKPLIYDNYASLKNRGTSFARKRINVQLQRFMREYGEDGYILQVDVRKFFDSVNHDILKKMLRTKLQEPPEVMDLIDYIIDTSSDTDCGLSLGSEAPQIFAIFYLSGLDNFIKSVKGVRYYGRYMDDLFVLSNSKAELRDLSRDIEKQLHLLKLQINKRKTQITKLSHGFTFMQIKYHISNGKIIKRPTRQKIVRERRRLKKYKLLHDKKVLTEFHIHNCYKSWRNAVVKDCNACIRSIKNLDALYERLFPEHESYHRLSREDVIRRAFRRIKEDKHVQNYLVGW